jgi:O-antigen/teichoic acid export membrane protein
VNRATVASEEKRGQAPLPRRKRGLPPFLGNLSALAVANVVGNVFAFIAVARAADLLGPAGFGRLSFAQAFASYFVLAGEFGLPMIAVRESARLGAAIGGLLRAVLATRLALAGAAFLALLAALPLVPGPPETARLTLLFGAAVFGNALLLEWPFQGLERMGIVAAARVLRPGLYAALVIVLVRGPGDAGTVALLSLAGLGSAVLLLAFALRHLGWDPGEPVAPRTLLRDALPFAASALLVQLYTTMDATFLGYLKDAAAVGQYSAGSRINGFLVGLGGLFAATLLPRLASAPDRRTADEELGGGIAAAWTVLLPVAAGGLVTADALLDLLYGAEYAAGGGSFALLLWGVPVSAISGLLWHALAARSGSRVPVRAVALGLLANGVLNLALIPWLGGPGAAAATVGAEVLTAAVILRRYRASGGRAFVWPRGPVLVATAGMVAALAVLPSFAVVGQVALGAGLYVTILLALRARAAARELALK